MEVSDTKSNVIASTPKIAHSIVDGSSNKKVQAATIAQLLGNDTAGSKRRRTQTQQKRFVDVRACKHRIRSLRRSGVISLETIGVSDSSLMSMRSSIAKAVTHDAGGKNTDIALQPRWRQRESWSSFPGVQLSYTVLSACLVGRLLQT